jgi:hypothetical protein
VAEDSEIQNGVKKIFELEWRQGSVVSDELFQQLSTREEFPSKADTSSGVLIVVSQDCDVCNDSYEKEPWVELLLAIPVEKPNGTFFNGNHPRIIQFEMVNAENTKVFESSIHDKFRIDRKKLIDYPPNSHWNLKQRTIRDIKHWLARRYTRQAFPNEFERRISSSKSKWTRKLFAVPEKGGLITAIFLLVSEDELPKEEKYKVIMWLTMLPEDYNIQEKKEVVEKIAGQIADAMNNNCEGIEVVEYEVRSEANVSLEERNQLKRWDYDALSFAEDLSTILDN